MADDPDPLAGYTPSKKPPQAAGALAPGVSGTLSAEPLDPLAGYTPTSAAAAPAVPPGGSAFDPSWKPSSTGNPLWDAFSNVMTRPIAKTEDPLLAARDYGLSIWDTASGGFGVPASLKDATAQAHANLGVMDYPASALAYAAGPGRLLGPLARGIVGTAAPGVTAFGAPLAARIAGGVGASALEGGAASGIGAAGHGGSAGDIAKATALGTAIGGGVSGISAGLGALAGGGAGAAAAAGGPTPKGPTAADVGEPYPRMPGTMEAKKTDAYAPLDSTYFDNSTLNAGINQGQTVIRNLRDPQGQGVSLGVPSSVDSIITPLSREPVVTGRIIQQASSDLRGTGDWTGHRFADGLDNVLATGQPMSIGGAPTGQVGEAAAARARGDALFGTINDLNRLKTDPNQLTPSAIKETMGRYAPSPGQQPGPQYQSLVDLQNATQPGFNWWHLRHAAGPLLGAGLGAAEGYFNPAEGQNPWVRAGTEGVEGAALFSGLPALAKARPGPALNAARYTIGTGQPMTTAIGRAVGDPLSSLLFGRGMSNYQWPY